VKVSLKTALMASGLCFVCALANADFFSDLAKNNPAKVNAENAKAEWFNAQRDGVRPSIEAVRDYAIPAALDDLHARAIGQRPYFKLVLPYFYQYGGHQGEDFVWDQEKAAIVKEQRGWCLDQKYEANKAQAELDIAIKTAPVGQYGARIFPSQQQSKFDYAIRSIQAICMGVDPGGFNGNQVWLSMENSKQIKKKGSF